MPAEKKQLSPLAQKYKDAFEGRMFVFDMDGFDFLILIIERYLVVVLDGHSP